MKSLITRGASRVSLIVAGLAACLMVLATNAHAQTTGPAYDTLGATAQTDLVSAITKILPPVLGVLVVVSGSKMLIRWIGARAR